MPLRTKVLNECLSDFVSAKAIVGADGKMRADRELLPYSYFDTLLVTGASDGSVSCASEYIFFQQQKGSAGVTAEDTNMVSPAKIGVPYRFLAQYCSISILPKYDATDVAFAVADPAVPAKSLINDIAKVLTRGIVTMTLLDKDYLNVGPLMALPAGEGLEVSGLGMMDTGALLAGYAKNGWGALSNKYAIEVPMAGENTFNVKIAFPKGVFVVRNSFRIKVQLDGILQRPVM